MLKPAGFKAKGFRRGVKNSIFVFCERSFSTTIYRRLVLWDVALAQAAADAVPEVAKATAVVRRVAVTG